MVQLILVEVVTNALPCFHICLNSIGSAQVLVMSTTSAIRWISHNKSDAGATPS